jgi:hypothetical protein
MELRGIIKKRKWYEELQDERTKDIQAEMMMEKQ